MTSLTVKPHLLRADTIDLQSHDNPSAKDHTRGQYQTGYSHAGPSQAGNHHTQALRNANHDAFHERHTSPRLAEFDHGNMGPQDQSHMYDEGSDDEDDLPPNSMNGVSHNGYDADEGNDSQDEDMDDELLDKISSSPSIEDGKPHWPIRADSLFHGRPDSCAAPTRGISYSPASPAPGPTGSISSSRSSSVRQSSPESPKRRINFGDMPRLSPSQRYGLVESNSIDNIGRHLLPVDDPFLDQDLATSYDDINFDDLVWQEEPLFRDFESSDDEEEEAPFDADSRFIDSGWGGECLRDTEDIDFEFVYALHTFVATVEGQANATKGDTMVLLDDSNSYWWLVRVVKDGSIGYLPAEHIETPTERLARLNKHRNIDLSAAMLGDNPEKSKNPLKKAMRRRNAKTVNFAPPTYYEPEERQWSDEDDDVEDDEDDMHVETEANQEPQQEPEQAQQTQQPLQGLQARQVDSNIESQRAQSASATIHHVEGNEQTDMDELSSPVQRDALTPAPLQTNSQDNIQRSRKGVVRNTDSFFRDDTVETKKISLTPQLLRGESATNGTSEQDTTAKQRPGLDTFDKVVGEDKNKDSKKKEKKGMLSGLFKRKSSKGGKNEVDESDRMSEDSGRSPQSKESMDSDLIPERKPSKLQKTPPVVVSPKASPVESRAPQRDFGPAIQQQSAPIAPQKSPVEAPTVKQLISQLGEPEQGQQPSRFPSLQEKRSVFAPITGALRSKNSSQDMGDSTIKPVYSKRAKERFAIDEESDSEDDSTPTAQSSILHRSISPLENNENDKSRPDSDMRVSPFDYETRNNARSPLAEPKPAEKPIIDQQVSMQATPTSPSDQTASTSKQSPSIPTHTPSTSRSTPTWSDASLRSYMDNDDDVRDLLLIVHDKSNVTPVNLEHPLMNGLFAAERTKLADMQTQLDSMLITWLSRKTHNGTTKV